MSKIDKIVSANLKSRRIKAGYTLEQMADMIGCDPTRLSLIEKALHVISPTFIYQACFILNCKPADLFPPLKAEAGKGETKNKELRQSINALLKRLKPCST